MKNFIILCVLCFINSNALAQQEVSLNRTDVVLKGTYLKGSTKQNTAILFISGSGPTDRDGNSAGIGKNNGLKLLATALQEKGYSSLRFDKRMIGESVSENLKMEDINFNQYVDDVKAWISYLKKNHEQVIVLGHSLGGLIGVKAIQSETVDGFIALASICKPISETLHQQFQDQPPVVKDVAIALLDSVVAGHKPKQVPSYLLGLFGPKILPYLQSFINLDIKEEIQVLNIPVLVVQGTHDIQILTKDAQVLAAAYNRSTYAQLEEMNHVLKKAPADRNLNFATYSNPNLPLHSELVPTIFNFLNKF